MSVFKCKMCGGTIEFEPGATVGICDSCGTKQTLPRLDDDRRANLYDRANHFRRNNEFDKAMGIYEQILNEDNTDAEAYWSLVLCRYGIEYVEDPSTHKQVPTVNRAQYTSIFDDDNYKSALHYADGFQRSIYEEEAKTINEIQKGILAISQKEDPFDVFICYKETDSNGRRTPDSVLANDLYHQLTQEGFKVFFARITLEDKLGTAYEPYIFAALNSAKVMVVLGTKPEYFNAVWVKNEWSRYLSLVKQSNGKKTLIPAYKDMDPYDLPDEFSHLQAQDMSKLGFMQDLIRGITKIARADEPKTTAKDTVIVSNGSGNVTTLLKRAAMSLEDREWIKANDFCEQVLNLDPENAEAYTYMLMAEMKVSALAHLRGIDNSLDGNKNYQKAIRYSKGDLSAELKDIQGFILLKQETKQKIAKCNADIKENENKLSSLREPIVKKQNELTEKISKMKTKREWNKVPIGCSVPFFLTAAFFTFMFYRVLNRGYNNPNLLIGVLAALVIAFFFLKLGLPLSKKQIQNNIDAIEQANKEMERLKNEYELLMPDNNETIKALLNEKQELNTQLDALWEPYKQIRAEVASMSSPVVKQKADEDGNTYAVVLASFKDNKISVIKEIRGILGLGLAEAKELVESAPVIVKSGLSEEAARDICAKLDAAGGSARIKPE